MDVSSADRDFHSDLRLIAQLRTLLTAVISTLVGYRGPVAEHDVDQKAMRELDRRLFRDLDGVLDSPEYRKVHSQYREASRTLEEPGYWHPKELPPEIDSVQLSV